MTVAFPDSDSLLLLLLEKLGYNDDPDYLSPAVISKANPGVRNALDVAFNRIGIAGALCPRSSFATRSENGDTAFRAMPVSYVAVAANEVEAERLHRAIWSQSIVPQIILVMPDGCQVRNGFDYRYASEMIPWPEVRKSLPEALVPLTAVAIRSAVSWRNFAVPSRVDARIGEDIRNLSKAVHRKHPELRDRQELVNAVIGRFLYLNVLTDRRIIDQRWIENLRDGDGNALCPNIRLREPNGVISIPDWPAKEVWALFDAIDEVLNGAIFPIENEDRKLINVELLNLIRRVLRANRIDAIGNEQYAFLELDYSVIRTETISAIYECFFDLEGNGARRKHGAFYTPSYLVDYILDEVDQTRPFGKDSLILDPACGSGAFVVAAFRRIIEAERKGGALSARDLRVLLQRCIRGKELKEQAANVARFSLYLTMLDYLPELKLSEVPTLLGNRKLFPDLRSRVRFTNAFAPTENVMPRKATHVLGNPPWTAISDDPLATVYLEQRANERSFVGVSKDSLAELFYWRSLEDYCRSDSIVALVMPAKSLFAPTAKAFPKAVAEHSNLIGIANLTSFRRKLFSGAEEAAVVMFASPGQSDPIAWSWRYSPKLTGQPLGNDGVPWAIVIDRGQVERFRRSELLLDGRNWQRDLLLQPLDRYIIELLEEPAPEDTASKTLGDFFKVCGIAISPGEVYYRIGLPNQYVLGTNGDQDFRKRLGLEKRDRLGSSIVRSSDYAIPDKLFAKLNASRQVKYGGPMILQPRSKASAHVWDGRAAYNSSLIGIYFQDRTAPRAKRIEILSQIALYRDTKVGRYFTSLYGRQWIIDERRFEADDLESLPFPYRGWEDLIEHPISEMEAADTFSAFVASRLDLPDFFVDAVNEHHLLREPFQNGKMDEVASDPVEQGDLSIYSRLLTEEVSRLLADTPVRAELGRRSPGTLEIRMLFSSDDTAQLPAQGRHFETPQFSEEGAVFLQDHGTFAIASIVKPDARTAWTAERAFADAINVARRVMQ